MKRKHRRLASKDEMSEENITAFVEIMQELFNLGPVEGVSRLEQYLKEQDLGSSTELLCSPPVIESFQVDVFWVLHVNGILPFVDYLLVSGSRVPLFIRNCILDNCREDSDPDVIVCSMAADIFMYIFDHSFMKESTHSNFSRLLMVSVLFENASQFTSSDVVFLTPDDLVVISEALQILSISASDIQYQLLQVSIMKYLIRTEHLCGHRDLQMAHRLVRTLSVSALETAIEESIRSPIANFYHLLIRGLSIAAGVAVSSHGSPVSSFLETALRCRLEFANVSDAIHKISLKSFQTGVSEKDSNLVKNAILLVEFDSRVARASDTSSAGVVTALTAWIDSSLDGTFGAISAVKTLSSSAMQDFQFLCMTLCEAVTSMTAVCLQSVGSALRLRREWHLESVNMLLSTARMRITALEASKVSGLSTSGVASTAVSDLTTGRLKSWITLLQRTQCLPAGVSQACSVHGSKGLFAAMEFLLNSSAFDATDDADEIRSGCREIALFMTKKSPPMCTAEESSTFIDRIKKEKHTKDNLSEGVAAVLRTISVPEAWLGPVQCCGSALTEVLNILRSDKDLRLASEIDNWRRAVTRVSKLLASGSSSLSGQSQSQQSSPIVEICSVLAIAVVQFVNTAHSLTNTQHSTRACLEICAHALILNDLISAVVAVAVAQFDKWTDHSGMYHPGIDALCTVLSVADNNTAAITIDLFLMRCIDKQPKHRAKILQLCLTLCLDAAAMPLLEDSCDNGNGSYSTGGREQSPRSSLWAVLFWLQSLPPAAFQPQSHQRLSTALQQRLEVARKEAPLRIEFEDILDSLQSTMFRKLFSWDCSSLLTGSQRPRNYSLKLYGNLFQQLRCKINARPRSNANDLMKLCTSLDHLHNGWAAHFSTGVYSITGSLIDAMVTLCPVWPSINDWMLSTLRECIKLASHASTVPTVQVALNCITCVLFTKATTSDDFFCIDNYTGWYVWLDSSFLSVINSRISDESLQVKLPTLLSSDCLFARVETISRLAASVDRSAILNRSSPSFAAGILREYGSQYAAMMTRPTFSAAEAINCLSIFEAQLPSGSELLVDSLINPCSQQIAVLLLRSRIKPSVGVSAPPDAPLANKMYWGIYYHHINHAQSVAVQRSSVGADRSDLVILLSPDPVPKLSAQAVREDACSLLGWTLPAVLLHCDVGSSSTEVLLELADKHYLRQWASGESTGSSLCTTFYISMICRCAVDLATYEFFGESAVFPFISIVPDVRALLLASIRRLNLVSADDSVRPLARDLCASRLQGCAPDFVIKQALHAISEALQIAE